jgi:hypothetical protein
MADPITLEALEARLQQIDSERDLLIQMIALRKGEPSVSKTPLASIPKSGTSSVRGRVIDAVIELIHKTGRQVTNREILEFIEAKQLSLGNVKNRSTGLGAILSQESAKTTARIKQVARGVYDIK